MYASRDRHLALRKKNQHLAALTSHRLRKAVATGTQSHQEFPFHHSVLIFSIHPPSDLHPSSFSCAQQPPPNTTGSRPAPTLQQEKKLQPSKHDVRPPCTHSLHSLFQHGIPPVSRLIFSVPPCVCYVVAMNDNTLRAKVMKITNLICSYIFCFESS